MIISYFQESNYSLNDQELNQIIVKMRNSVRKAKDFFIQKRIKRISKFNKNREANEKRINRNEKFITTAKVFLDKSLY